MDCCLDHFYLEANCTTTATLPLSSDHEVFTYRPCATAGERLKSTGTGSPTRPSILAPLASPNHQSNPWPQL